MTSTSERSCAVPFMPFVSVASAGGPHDDASYAAGYECGWVDGQLESGCHPTSVIVQIENLLQLDLVARRHGYWMTFVSATDDQGQEIDGYALASFVPQDSDQPS